MARAGLMLVDGLKHLLARAGPSPLHAPRAIGGKQLGAQEAMVPRRGLYRLAELADRSGAVRGEVFQRVWAIWLPVGEIGQRVRAIARANALITKAFILINSNNAFMQTEASINQRLEILIDFLGLNARSFSHLVGVNDDTTRIYLDRGSKPSAEYVASIIGAVERINPTWLLLGRGEMFLDGAPEVQTVDAKRPEAGEQVDFEKEVLRKEVEMLWTLVASRDALIESKDAVIAAKEETLSVLREGRNRAN